MTSGILTNLSPPTAAEEMTITFMPVITLDDDFFTNEGLETWPELSVLVSWIGKSSANLSPQHAADEETLKTCFNEVWTAAAGNQLSEGGEKDAIAAEVRDRLARNPGLIHVPAHNIGVLPSVFQRVAEGRSRYLTKDGRWADWEGSFATKRPENATSALNKGKFLAPDPDAPTTSAESTDVITRFCLELVSRSGHHNARIATRTDGPVSFNQLEQREGLRNSAEEFHRCAAGEEGKGDTDKDGRAMLMKRVHELLSGQVPQGAGVRYEVDIISAKASQASA